MSFSLIYICCSFRGRILSVVFPAVAICFWPAGNLECPCLFSDLFLFPFILLFFYIVPHPSFSSMFFSLTYICCSFRGGILSVVFPTVAICFCRREPGVPLSLFPTLSSSLLSSFSSILFLIPYPSFSSMFFSLTYICCSFRGGILSVVFPTVAICFCRREPGVPLSLFPTLSSSLLSSFSSILFLIPYPCFSSMSFFHWSTSAVVSGEAFYLLFSPL